MTLNEIINYECQRLEEIRQYLIKKLKIEEMDLKDEIRSEVMTTGKCIAQLGEIIYELETNLKDKN